MKNVNKIKWSLVALSLVFVFGLLSPKLSLEKNGDVGSKVLLAKIKPPSVGVGSTDGQCGFANGSAYNKKPTTNLCLTGTIVWLDEKGYGGYYNWKCKSKSTSRVSYCSAKVKRGSGGKF